MGPFQVFIVELIRGKLHLDDNHPVKILNWNVSPTYQNIYKFVGFFSFGAACCQLSTEISKYSIGRFRPHFLSVSFLCKDIFDLQSQAEQPIASEWRQELSASIYTQKRH